LKLQLMVDIHISWSISSCYFHRQKVASFNQCRHETTAKSDCIMHAEISKSRPLYCMLNRVGILHGAFSLQLRLDFC